MVNTMQLNCLEGVGKTSIILTIVSEQFPRQVPKKYQRVQVSSDLYMLPTNTLTSLIDSSTAREDEQKTIHEIEKANVIILVYDVNYIECIKRIRSYWLPTIMKANNRVRKNLL